MKSALHFHNVFVSSGKRQHLIKVRVNFPCTRMTNTAMDPQYQPQRYEIYISFPQHQKDLGSNSLGKKETNKGGKSRRVRKRWGRLWEKECLLLGLLES